MRSRQSILLTRSCFSVELFPQPPGAEDVSDGDEAPRRIGDSEGGERKSPGSRREAERGDQGAGSPVEPGHGEQHRPAKAAAGNDGHRPQPAQSLLQRWR